MPEYEPCPRDRCPHYPVAAMEIATMLGVTPQRIHNRRHDGSIVAPRWLLSIGWLWERSEVVAWAHDRGLAIDLSVTTTPSTRGKSISAYLERKLVDQKAAAVAEVERVIRVDEWLRGRGGY